MKDWSGSGSVMNFFLSGSYQNDADPDPHKNDTDPLNWCSVSYRYSLYTVPDTDGCAGVEKYNFNVCASLDLKTSYRLSVYCNIEECSLGMAASKSIKIDCENVCKSATRYNKILKIFRRSQLRI